MPAFNVMRVLMMEAASPLRRCYVSTTTGYTRTHRRRQYSSSRRRKNFKTDGKKAVCCTATTAL